MLGSNQDGRSGIFAMAKEKRSFTTCFFMIIGLMALLIIVLLASMDYIQKKFELDKPDSKVGRKIDEMIPQMDAVANYDRAKLKLQLIHMRGIKDAFVMYYIQDNRWPSSLQEMVSRQMVNRDAVTDLWQHAHRYLPLEREVYLVSGGPDRIVNTADDLIVTLVDPSLEAPESDRGKVVQLIAQQVLAGKTGVPAQYGTGLSPEKE